MVRQTQFVRSNRGLTLIELLIILGLIATLSTIALLLYANFTDQARTARAVADIAVLASEISTFESTNERLPNDLAEIGRATLRDPWGRPYEYLNVSLSPGLARKEGPGPPPDQLGLRPLQQGQGRREPARAHRGRESR